MADEQRCFSCNYNLHASKMTYPQLRFDGYNNYYYYYYFYCGDCIIGRNRGRASYQITAVVRPPLPII